MKNLKSWALWALVAIFYSVHAYADEDKEIILFAAASLTNAMTEISDLYEKERAIPIKKSFAASSALAKQIEFGAPADIYISADTKWMQYLQDKAQINTQTRKNLLANQLVIIAPKGKGAKVETKPGFDFANSFKGKLCTADVNAVPAGRYAKQSLTALGWWESIKERIVGAQDVRATLVMVERSECNLGVVYATDADISSKVEVVAIFPEDSHTPIIYPVALTNRANTAASDFLHFLSSDQAKAIFSKYHFVVLD